MASHLDTLLERPFSKRSAPGASDGGVSGVVPDDAPLEPKRLDAPLPPGARAGEYVLDEILGEGAFGTVYRAAHAVIGKPAAVKVLALKYAIDPTIAARFVEEARAVNRIAHPDIIDIFGFGQLPDGRHFYVMELLAGRTLLELLQSEAPLSPPDALAILERVASALDAAHAVGIAHRDVKPANIFLHELPEGRRAKLLDFGIAKLSGDQSDGNVTESGATVGTPSYMSPEQCIGKNVDHRADIYSFGVVAFELLTGRVPFVEDSSFRLMAAHVNEPVPDPRELNPTLPRETHAALLTIMAKTPDDRPATVMGAVELLRAALDGVSTSAPGPRSASRHRAGVYVTAGLSLAAGVVLVGMAVSSTGTDRSDGPRVAEVAPLVVTTVADARSAAAPETPPAAPSSIDVRVELAGLPAGARVYGPEGEVLMDSSGAVTLPHGEEAIELRVSAEGFSDQTLSIVPLRDRRLDVALPRTPEAPEGGSRARGASSSKRKAKPPTEDARRGPNDLEPW